MTDVMAERAFRVRDFRWTDIPAAVSIDAQAFPYDPWSAETFWSELARVPAAATYVSVVDDEELLGYGGMTFIDEDAHLQTLAIVPELRGRGIGRRVLSGLLRDAVDRGATRCLLEVKPDNEAAIGLYTGLGFEPLGTRPGYYPGGEEALVLACELGAAS